MLRELNFACKQGEIDIVGFHQGYLVFVEVKYRKNAAKGRPEEAVDAKKQKRICKAADYYRMVKGYDEQMPVRYDVIAIQGDENQQVCWYQDAFAHIY